MNLIHTLKELKSFCKTGLPHDSKSSAWKRSFETLRKKCDRVPMGASASEKTTNLITLSDEALLAEWEKARRDITTGPELPTAAGMTRQMRMGVPGLTESARGRLRRHHGHGLLAPCSHRLRLDEVWQYRELLHFFVCRVVNIRCKLLSDGLPYAVFYFAALVPWTYFS